MAGEILSERRVIGAFRLGLETLDSTAWTSDLSSYIATKQISGEEYGWLGQVPTFKENMGDLTVEKMTENLYQIRNKKFHAAMEIQEDVFTDDGWGQVTQAVGELAGQSVDHFAELLSELLVNGEQAECYDGLPFFSTLHKESRSPVQSNITQVSIAAIGNEIGPTFTGSLTSITPDAMEKAIFRGVKAMRRIVDGTGERKVNMNVRGITVMVGPELEEAAYGAVMNDRLAQGKNSTLKNASFNVKVEVNPYIDAGNEFYIFRTDRNVKPLIRQEKKTPKLDVLGPESDHCIKTGMVLMKASTTRNVGFGMWQLAQKMRFVS